MIAAIRVLSFTLALALAACPFDGGQVIEVGKACNADADCSERTECVAAESPHADKVCMPVDEDSGQSD